MLSALQGMLADTRLAHVRVYDARKQPLMDFPRRSHQERSNTLFLLDRWASTLIFAARETGA